MKCTLSVHSCPRPLSDQIISGMARAACTDLLATRDVPDSHGVVAFSMVAPDALTTRVPSGENATEFTAAECPLSVHSCPQPLSDKINIGHGQGRIHRPPCHLRRPRFSQYYLSPLYNLLTR